MTEEELDKEEIAMIQSFADEQGITYEEAYIAFEGANKSPAFIEFAERLGTILKEPVPEYNPETVKKILEAARQPSRPMSNEQLDDFIAGKLVWDEDKKEYVEKSSRNENKEG